MKFFTLIQQEGVHPAPKRKKIIPAEEFSTLVEAEEILHKVQQEEIVFRMDVAKECETLKEEAEAFGYEEGLKRWAKQLRQLEEERRKIRQEIEQSLVPLALAAVKKIIGKEISLKPQTVVDIIATALKTVSQHRRITLYVNPTDLDLIEAQRSRLKALFEHLETLSIVPKEDVAAGGCNIETEAGIIRAQLEDLLGALESAFRQFFQTMK
jgi:type III secretion protein L